MKKKIMIGNIILFILIIYVLALRFFPGDIFVNADDNAISKKSQKKIANSFDIRLKADQLYLLFAFNNLPTKSELNQIEKLSKKYYKDINIHVYFAKKFEGENLTRFNHKFNDGKKLFLVKDDSALFENNYHFLLKGGELIYVHDSIDMQNIVLVVQKKIAPHLRYSDYVMTSSELHERLKSRILASSMNLLDARTGEMVTVEQSKYISKILFFHSSCSSCVLKSIFSHMKKKEILGDETNIIIFSALADRIKIGAMLKLKKIETPTYIDIADEFDLMTAITGDSHEPFIFNFDKSEIQNDKKI